jgi:hypothetical protein
MNNRRWPLVLAALPVAWLLMAAPVSAHDEHGEFHEDLNTQHHDGHNELNAEHNDLHNDLNEEHRDYHNEYRG